MSKAIGGLANSWYSQAESSPNQLETCSDSNQMVSVPYILSCEHCIKTTAGGTHHFFLPMRNFFFMKTIYLRGTQTSRAVEVI